VWVGVGVEMQVSKRSGGLVMVGIGWVEGGRVEGRAHLSSLRQPSIRPITHPPTLPPMHAPQPRTLEMVRAGLHWSLRMSRQMPPLALMLQW
jgi:hypothetical protein